MSVGSSADAALVAAAAVTAVLHSSGRSSGQKQRDHEAAPGWVRMRGCWHAIVCRAAARYTSALYGAWVSSEGPWLRVVQSALSGPVKAIEPEARRHGTSSLPCGRVQPRGACARGGRGRDDTVL